MNTRIKKSFITVSIFCFFLIILVSPVSAQTISVAGSCESPNAIYFSADVSWPNYATANAGGWCYTISKNSIPAQVCFQYVLPTDSLRFNVILVNCDGMEVGMGGELQAPPGCANQNWFGSTFTGAKTYNASCEVYSNDVSHGWCSVAGVAGDKITICYTLNTGACANDIKICPMIWCYSESCLSSLLPIELLFFNAKKGDNNTVHLNWATATETNNDYFTIERTVDGIIYHTIATVKGAGNSTTTLFYNTDDHSNPLTDQIVYYRLKQTDYDGKYAYSKLVSINSESAEDNLKLIYFYVANTNEVLGYGLDLFDSKNCSAQIIDMLGRIISSQKLEDTENTFRSIDISSLSKGSYFFKVTDGEEVIVKKFFH